MSATRAPRGRRRVRLVALALGLAVLVAALAAVVVLGGDDDPARDARQDEPPGTQRQERSDRATTEEPAETEDREPGVRRGDDPASVWLADAEGPIEEEWANVDCATPERVQQVAAPGGRGGRAYRFEIQDGDDPGGFGERCEVAQANPEKEGFPVFEEGDERWMSWQVYLPEDYPVETSDWNVIVQWKQKGGLGTPVLSMEVREGEFFFQRSEDQDDSTEETVPMWHGPARQGRWVRFTLHALFSPDPDVGFVELFGDLDGAGMQLLLPREQTFTMKREDGETIPSHVRMGIYRNKEISGTAHLYLDGVNVAKTREAAEEAAFGAGAS